MGVLAPLAALLGIETDALIDKARRQAIVLAVVALFGLIAVAFLLVALYLWLSVLWSPIIAALAIAIAAIVIALVVYGISRLSEGSKKAKEADRRRANETTAMMTTAAITALPVLFRSPLARSIGLPLAAIAAAAFFGKAVKDKHDEEAG
jgi:cobalamin synthase